ncbi:GxxExxY protein [uncultured Lamprocystis sp.]|jgi:GxxExxY protein|uniref:GxxExxY protein n=1 Tax=uncultured Lamprocystis sp. TaxID=543132 RepID=UPI0025CEFFDB|nr:GxxExxY protein [uncultured Lamprocystis sp.]
MQSGSDVRDQANVLASVVVDAAIEVHRILGPGLLESAYEAALAYELGLRGITVERQVLLPVHYKGEYLDAGFRLDLVVGKLLIVELKAVQHIEPIHEAQLLTYLRLSGRWLGLLLNFNVPLMKNGIRRMVNG